MKYFIKRRYKGQVIEVSKEKAINYVKLILGLCGLADLSKKNEYQIKNIIDRHSIGITLEDLRNDAEGIN